MISSTIINSNLIAPCGMNCGLCISYLRDKNQCLGCREMSAGKPEGCRKCTIMHCKILKEKNMTYCSEECNKFPCPKLRNMDKRYKLKYGMSMLENLKNIKKYGIRKFVDNEKSRWTCLNCGALICVHRKDCLNCGMKNEMYP